MNVEKWLQVDICFELVGMKNAAKLVTSVLVPLAYQTFFVLCCQQFEPDINQQQTSAGQLPRQEVDE